MAQGESVLIDGSFGEGGGQILRTSVTLSAILGRPVEVHKIRAGRDSPGLRPQHLSAVRAVGMLCDAHIEGLSIGSQRIRFLPGTVKPSRLRIDVGTAGSITLLLQTIIPVAAFAPGESEFHITGGTDVKWSPTTNYFKRLILPSYRKIGLNASLTVVRRGYYPQGGGQVVAEVEPLQHILPVEMVDLKSAQVFAESVCSNLPRSVAERQLSAARNHLFNHAVRCEDTAIQVEDALSPGTSILVWATGEDGPFLGGDAIGERGKPAEKVGREAAVKFLGEWESTAPVDAHLGDMLVHLLCLALGPSRLRVSRVTEHLRANLYVAEVFTRRKHRIEETGKRGAIISIDQK